MEFAVEKELQILYACKNLFFFSPLLHSLCTFYLLSLRSTIADDDEKRRERKTIVS